MELTMNDDVHTVFAATTFKYQGADVYVSLYAPQKAFPDSDQYLCRFRISGGSIEYSGRSIGYDSMQSLILSLKKIGTYLTGNDEIDASSIEWEGGTMEFPVFQNV